MIKRRLPPVHPGEILVKEFMEPHGLRIGQVAKALYVTPRRISDICHCKRPVTASMAVRLSLYFETSVDFWTGLQMDYDIQTELDLNGERIAAEVKPRDGLSTLAAKITEDNRHGEIDLGPKKSKEEW